MDAANGLQTILIPAAIPSLSSIHTEASLELVTIPSMSINRYSMSVPTLVASWSAPFSWMRAVDLNSFSQNLSTIQQSTRWTQPPKAQLDALFYSKGRSFLDTPHESHETSVPSYAIASLANNMSSVYHNVSNEAYLLLKAFPLNVVSQSLKAIPVPVLDALKERLFATAVKVGDVDLVSAMLKLNIDPRERIMIDWPSVSRPTYPLDYAGYAGHYAVVKTLVSHMCQGANQLQLDGLRDCILYGMEWTMLKERIGGSMTNYSHFKYFNESELTELMCIALAAGASPKLGCLRPAGRDISIVSLKKLVENTAAGIIAWLEIGLLKFYLGCRCHSWETCPIENVLQYVFSDCQHDLPRGDPKFKTIVLKALTTAIVDNKEEAAKTILRAFSLLGYRPNSEETYISNKATNDSIVQAFDNADWDLTISLILAQNLIAVRENSRQGLKETGAQQPIAMIFIEPPRGPSWYEQFNGAVREKDLVLAYQLLQDPRHLSSPFSRLPLKFVELAVSLGQSDMVINVIRSTENFDEWGLDEVFPLLGYGQIAAVSALLMEHPAWKAALDAACYHEGFGMLESMVFQGSDLPLFEEFPLYNDGDYLMQEQQVIFRVIAFHAIATNSFKLCEWLLQIGMDADELNVCEEEDDDMVVKSPVTHCSLPGVGGCSVRRIQCTIPSLLAVAAQHNREDWMKCLLAQGVQSADSGALLWAVKTKASSFPARASYAISADFLN